MSDDVVAAEPIARIRIIRRYSHYRIGDTIVMSLSQAQSLVAQRYAEALPPPAGFAVGDPSSRSPPQRQPVASQLVKKT